MNTPSHHPHIMAFLASLRAAGKASTAHTSEGYLRRFSRWLVSEGLIADRVTTADLERFQAYLKQHRTAVGQPLAATTLGTHSAIVRSLYDWLHGTGLLVVNPAATMRVPKQPFRGSVTAQHLSQQEAVALLATLDAQAAVARFRIERALAQRNLALIGLALATGRRCHGLLDLVVRHLDFDLHEMRVEREKGRFGRVLPVARWALALVRRYLDDGRLTLLKSRASDAVFVSQRSSRMCHKAVEYVLDAAIADTIAANPDLTELPQKRISTHSLRVSFATLIHAGGCDIRTLNELMLHRSLTTTAAYTPVTTNDLRRAMLDAEPRA